MNGNLNDKKKSFKGEKKASPIGQIYVTKDYTKFKTLDGNRALSRSQIKKLTRSFESEQIPLPIIINEKYEVIDGQHRYFSF